MSWFDGLAPPIVLVMKLTTELQRALARVLKGKRKAENLTQERLATLSGVPPRTIQRVERGDGISTETLGALANALRTDAAALLEAAEMGKDPSPELRLQLFEIRTVTQLFDTLTRRHGVMQIGPEGEHPFNEQIGGTLIELAREVPKRGTVPFRLTESADYLIAYTHQMGFRLFAGHYDEEVLHKGKLLRKATTLIIATPQPDSRIRKTGKGAVLDFVMDSRKQVMHRLLQPQLTIYDWMEHQLLAKSNGEERVRYVMRQIHESIRRGRKRRKRP